MRRRNLKWFLCDSYSGSSEEDFKNNKDNFFDKDINNQVKVSPQTNVNAKVD